MREKLYRKNSVTSVCVLFLIITLALCVCGQPGKDSQSEGHITDWDNIRSGFEKFVNHPCPNETRAFLETLPKDRTNKEKGDKEKFLKLMADWSYGVLKNEITSGNRPAIEAAFRLLSILEKQSLHHIRADLGHIIRLYPQVFLQLVYEYRDSYYMKSEGYPVSFFMTSYDQRWTTQLFELEMRLEALEKVNEEWLREAKEACIVSLKDEVEMLKKTIKLGNSSPAPLS